MRKTDWFKHSMGRAVGRAVHVSVFAMSAALAIPGRSQQPPAPASATVMVSDRPDAGLLKTGMTMFKLHAQALGPRALTSGKERTVLSAQLTDDKGGQSTVQITQQVPGLIDVRGVREGGTPLKFDGKRVLVPFTKAEERFLESVAADTVEALISAERNGIAIRFLGFNFKSQTEKPDRPEPRYDIYQVTMNSNLRPDGEKRTKLYWFDTDTHLLMRTTYNDAYDGEIETRFLNWGTSEGSRYPGRIERYEAGRQVLSLVVTGLSGGPKVEPAEFRP
jgi:hypothetical protein